MHAHLQCSVFALCKTITSSISVNYLTYCAFTHAWVGWLLDVCDEPILIGSLFDPLEDAICLKLILSPTGHDLVTFCS